MLEIILDSHIHIKGLSDEWVNGLSYLCAFENEEKQVALDELVWGAKNLPDRLTLAHYDGETLTLPRGFYTKLMQYLDKTDVRYNITDGRIFRPYTYQDSTEVLRADQKEAFTALIQNYQGRIIAPPGKGKTVIALSYLESIKGTHALIIVEQKHIAQQWIDRGKEHFDLDIGFIGDQKWEQKNITVALIQTLYSRETELDEGSWWQEWDCVILDEQHHIPAESYTKIISKFPAKRRFGFSATVGKSEAKKQVSELIFGPILYEDTEVQVVPEVHAIPTGFQHEYFPTQKIGNRVERNNYKEIIKDLVLDNDRNEIIANKIEENADHCNLIVSDRLQQLHEIDVLLPAQIKTYMLTGKESLDERMEVYEKADQGRCAIFSTVANEALDIPRIDRIHLVYPRKNEEAVWQIIGRGTRPHPDKTECIVYDYYDDCDILYRQYQHRLRALYKPKGMKIVKFK